MKSVMKVRPGHRRCRPFIFQQLCQCCNPFWQSISGILPCEKCPETYTRVCATGLGRWLL